MNGWIDGRMECYVEGWMESMRYDKFSKDGMMDGWRMDGIIDGWMDESVFCHKDEHRQEARRAMRCR